MISSVYPDKFERILKADMTEQDKDDLKKLWKNNLIGLSVFTVLGIAGLVAFIVDRSIVSGLFIFILALGLDLFSFYKFYKSSISARREYNATVERFGRSRLISELSSVETHAFYVVEDDVDAVTVITPNFLISARTFIIPFSSIKSMMMYEKRYTDEQIEKLNTDEIGREYMRNLYSVIITYKEGDTKKTLISVKRQDMGQFLNLLRIKAPWAEFGCPGYERGIYG